MGHRRRGPRSMGILDFAVVLLVKLMLLSELGHLIFLNAFRLLGILSLVEFWILDQYVMRQVQHQQTAVVYDTLEDLNVSFLIHLVPA